MLVVNASASNETEHEGKNCKNGVGPHLNELVMVNCELQMSILMFNDEQSDDTDLWQQHLKSEIEQNFDKILIVIVAEPSTQYDDQDVVENHIPTLLDFLLQFYFL